MNHDGDIERLLVATPAPRVVDGSHRAALKRDLLNQTRKESSVMLTWKRALAVCCAALVLAVGGWAAQKTIKRFVVERWQSEPETIVNPDGTVTVKSTGGCVTVGSNEPGFTQEQADIMWQETKEAIAEGNYKLIEVKDQNGKPLYIYRVFLPGGRTAGYGTHEPLAHPGT